MSTDATPMPEHGSSPELPTPDSSPDTSPSLAPYAYPRDAEAYYHAMWAAQAAAPQRAAGPGWGLRALVGVATAIVVAALGFPLGWLWSSVSPWLPATFSGGSLYYSDPEGDQSAAQESIYVLISVGAGILLAILAWLILRKFRGPIMVAALALGGCFAGWIMWRFGRSVGRDHARELVSAAKDGTNIKLPVDIRIERNGLWHGFIPYIAGDLVYLAIAAVAVYCLIAGFTAYADLVPRRHSRGAPSSDVDESSDAG